MRAIGRQLDQMDAAIFAREKSPDTLPFVVGCVVPDHVDDAFILIVGFNFGQQLHGTHADASHTTEVHGGHHGKENWNGSYGNKNPFTRKHQQLLRVLKNS